MLISLFLIVWKLKLETPKVRLVQDFKPHVFSDIYSSIVAVNNQQGISSNLCSHRHLFFFFIFFLFFFFAEAQLCTGRILNFGRNSLKRTGTPGSHRNRPKFHLKWNKGCVIPVCTLVRYSVSAVPAEIPDFGRTIDTCRKQKHRLLCNFSLA